MPPEILELEPGKLVLIGIGLALITIILVGLGYCTARIMAPKNRSFTDEDDETSDECEAELSAFQSVQNEHERTEVIKHIASRVIHDFNNIVFAVSGRIQILKRKTEDPAVLKSLDDMEKALDTSIGIFGALSKINTSGSAERSSILIGAEVNELSVIASALMPTTIELSIDDEVPKDTMVRLSQSTLQQVLLGILANAVEAITPNEGRIKIRLSRSDDQPHEFVLLTFDDDGPGMQPELRAKAFTSFYSTKGTSPVDGLGLSIAKRLLGEQGASIALKESPLGGLQVEITLRLHHENE